MNYKKLLALFLWAYAGLASAQNIVRTDTVELARKLSYTKQYTQATSLLRAFELNHPDDINSVRLHGQILYWQKDFDGAFVLFYTALKRNPNHYVQLDYGRMLFELYHLADARLLLEDYIKTDPNNIEALIPWDQLLTYKAVPPKRKPILQGLGSSFPLTIGQRNM